MPNKIKIFFGFLVLIALFSVYSIFNSLSGKPVPFAAIGIEKNLPSPDTDADRDGLSNKEESYWNTDFQNPDTDGDGFLDGEEVASGRDPLTPGPDDILLYGSNNITANITDLIIGGLYTKDLKPGTDNEKYDKAISDLSLSVIDDFYSTPTDQKNISPTLTDNSPENQKNYLNNMAKIIKENLLDFPEKLDTGKQLDQQSGFFLNKSFQYKKSYDALSKMPVPKNWEFVHRAALDILNRLALNYFSISSYNSDPIKSFLSLNEVQQNIQPAIRELLQQVQLKIRENNLTLDNDVYEVLNLIYK